MNREVVDPHHEDRDVDGEHPEHEDEDGVCVVVEIIVGARSLETSTPQLMSRREMNAAYCLPRKPQRPRAGCYLYNAGDHVCELIWNECGHQKEKDGGGNDSPSWRTGRRYRGRAPPVSSVSKGHHVRVQSNAYLLSSFLIQAGFAVTRLYNKQSICKTSRAE